jgi:hypothetical protein
MPNSEEPFRSITDPDDGGCIDMTLCLVCPTASSNLPVPVT